MGYGKAVSASGPKFVPPRYPGPYSKSSIASPGEGGRAPSSAGALPATAAQDIARIDVINRLRGQDWLPTKLCVYWMKDPSLCAKGNACTFAHGEHELSSQQAQGSQSGIDSTSIQAQPLNFKTQLCKFFDI